MDELIFQYIEVRPQVEHPTKAMLRHRDGAHVLIRDKFNRWVVGHKNRYPDGMGKFLGGGIEEGEGPMKAAQRELKEEIGLEIDEDRLIPLVHVDVFDPKDPEKVAFSDFVFYCAVPQSMEAGDDVNDFMNMSEHDLQRMIGRMADLPETAVNDQSPSTWHDWGLVWGPIHTAALERVKELGL